MAIQLDYLCDHPALIAEFAELNFNEWGHYQALYARLGWEKVEDVDVGVVVTVMKRRLTP